MWIKYKNSQHKQIINTKIALEVVVGVYDLIWELT